jgi:hypothetical protein
MRSLTGTDIGDPESFEVFLKNGIRFPIQVVFGIDKPEADSEPPKTFQDEGTATDAVRDFFVLHPGSMLRILP